jgi:hypothetical protein
VINEFQVHFIGWMRRDTRLLITDLHRIDENQNVRWSGLRFQSRLLQSDRDRSGTPIQARHFASIAFDQTVIDLHAVKSCHDMFNHLNLGGTTDQLGSQMHVDPVGCKSAYRWLTG